MASRRGTTIRIFLVDGTPQGLRVIDRTGWTGACLAFSRADYARARQREELASTGVYILTGPDAEHPDLTRVYVGEADEVRTRLDQHQREKDFWTAAYVFASKDRSLNKAHVRYLEARLVQLAKVAGRAVVENSTAPQYRGLSEAETADMDSYLDEMEVLLPLMGVSAFEVLGVSSTTAVPISAGKDPGGTEPGHRYRLAAPSTSATGADDPRGFLVFEGSTGRSETKVMTSTYEELRNRLLSEGVLVPEGTEQLRLTKNYLFASPSAAATVLTGGNKNGRDVWRDEAGRTLKENQAATVVPPVTGVTAPDEA